MPMYCPQCDKEQETKIITKVETFPVKGQKISITSTVRVCSSCDDEIWDPELDDENLKKAYDKYREMNGLLSPVQIKNIRMQYGLSQSAFANVLGLGEKTITRYENGSIQDEAQNNLILLASDPVNFDKLLRKSKLKVKENEQFSIKSLSIPSYQLKNNVITYHFSACCNDQYHLAENQPA